MKTNRFASLVGAAAAASLALALAACGGSGSSQATQAKAADEAATETETQTQAQDGSLQASVHDADGNPVADVGVAFCDDNSCNIAYTDEAGIATFAGNLAKDYEVHVAIPPQGFEASEESFQTSAGEPSFTLTRQ